MNSPIGEAVGQAVVGFALAAIFELAPTPTLGDERKRLAYNLRIRSYEEVGEFVISALGPRLQTFRQFAVEEAERAMSVVKGDVKPPVQPAPDTHDAAGASAAVVVTTGATGK